MVGVLVCVADGSEEMETVIVVDVLRRAQVEVTLAAVGESTSITCSRGVCLTADANLSEVSSSAGLDGFDAIVLPGGLAGAQAFAGASARASAVAPCTSLHALLKHFEEEKKVIAAICAAPLALVAANVAKFARITSHPSVKDQLLLHTDYFKEYSEERVVVDRESNLITSRGPGTSFEFALSLVKLLCGSEKAHQVAAPMVLQPEFVIV